MRRWEGKMSKIVRNIVALGFFISSGIYFIPQESISMFEFLLTMLLCFIGAMFLDLHKNGEDSHTVHNASEAKNGD